MKRAIIVAAIVLLSGCTNTTQNQLAAKTQESQPKAAENKDKPINFEGAYTPEIKGNEIYSTIPPFFDISKDDGGTYFISGTLGCNSFSMKTTISKKGKFAPAKDIQGSTNICDPSDTRNEIALKRALYSGDVKIVDGAVAIAGITMPKINAKY